MLRFVHTADWQIGMKAAHVGAAAERVREARLASARRVVELARDRGAAFIVLAGDTFEDNGIDRVLARKVAEILRASPAPVFILPGNHDPLVPGSVLDEDLWRAAEAVRILRDASPIDIAGARLFPCPLRERTSSRDPTRAIPPADPGVQDPRPIRIGIAHGSIAGIAEDADDFPIPPDAAERAGLDYLALGHWHSHLRLGERAAYSGTHETTKFGERESGRALVVEIDGPGASPGIEVVPTGTLRWIERDSEIAAAEDLAALRADLEREPNADRSLLRVELRGTVPVDGLREVEAIREVLEARFLFGEIEASRLLPAPEDERWIESLPAGAIAAAARSILAHATGEDAGGAAVAREALAILYAIAREGGR
ncbi:MAG: DNA repair exonuclease [Planctomycetes bacterium]|nr:DNA repair exonuclease [Planctomycetota bacterium]